MSEVQNTDPLDCQGMRSAFLLLAIATVVLSQGQHLTGLQKREVFNAISQALHEHFYDEKLNGVDWPSVEKHYLPRFEQAEDARCLRDLAREVLNLVDASHTLVSARGFTYAAIPTL